MIQVPKIAQCCKMAPMPKMAPFQENCTNAANGSNAVKWHQCRKWHSVRNGTNGQHVLGYFGLCTAHYRIFVCLTIQAPVDEWYRPRHWSRKPEIPGSIPGLAHFPSPFIICRRRSSFNLIFKWHQCRKWFQCQKMAPMPKMAHNAKKRGDTSTKNTITMYYFYVVGIPIQYDNIF